MSTSLLRKQTHKILDYLHVRLPKDLEEIAIYFVGKKTIQNLHKTFMNDATATDVITFEHGEIFICPEVAHRQSVKFNQTLHQELLTYIAHGLLHLSGLDDATEKQFNRMAKLQQDLVTRAIIDS